MADRSQVRNAASPDQVRRAERREKRLAELSRAALVEVMRSPAGRMVLWDLLERAGIYRSIFTTNAEIYYRAGRQDFGHELLAMILEADEAGYEVLEREARARKRSDNAETDAAHTPSSTEGAEHDG